MADNQKLANILMKDAVMKKLQALGGNSDYVIQSPNPLPNDYIIQSPNPAQQDNSPYIAKNPYPMPNSPETLNKMLNWGNAQKLKQMYEMQDNPQFQNIPTYK